MQSTRGKPQHVWPLAGIACAVLPYSLLLARTPGFKDWVNHVWLVNYFARFFATHAAFPQVLNTFEASGLASPVFYGYLFYPVMGLISTFFDANVTIRLCILAAMAAQFLTIYFTVFDQTQSRRQAFAVGTIFAWSLYPMSNVYLRTALPEFFACTFLAIACAALIRAANAATTSRLWIWNNLAVISLCAAAGTHPITALIGILFFIVLTLTAAIAGPRLGWKALVISLMVPSLVAAICLSPWLISTVKYSSQLEVSLGSARCIGSSHSIQWADLLSFKTLDLIYHHARHVCRGIRLTPFFVGRTNYLIAVVWGYQLWLLWQNKRLGRRLLYASLVLLSSALTFTCLTLDQYAMELPLLYIVQYTLRFSTYANLSLLCGLLFALNPSIRTHAQSSSSTLLDLKSAQKWGSMLTAVCIFSAVTLCIHVCQWSLPATPLPVGPNIMSRARTDTELLHLPKYFNGVEDYAVPRMVQRLQPDNAGLVDTNCLQPGTGKSFGLLTAQPVSPKDGCWFATNIIAFPWNRLLLNGSVVPNEQLRRTYVLKPSLTARERENLLRTPPDLGNYLAFSTKSDAVVSYKFEPDAAWDLLNKIALPLFGLWLAASLICTIIATLGTKKTDEALQPTDRPSIELIAR